MPHEEEITLIGYRGKSRQSVSQWQYDSSRPLSAPKTAWLAAILARDRAEAQVGPGTQDQVIKL